MEGVRMPSPTTIAVASTTVISSAICSAALRLNALRTALFSLWLVRQLTLQRRS
jgi:hypothetical protein